MQASIELSKSISIAGETHYFDNLRVSLSNAATKSINEYSDRERIENYFLALTHRPFGHDGDPEKGWMSRAELRNKANEQGGSPDSYFKAFCEIWATRNDARIWGEKTPRHVFRINEILSCFPDAKIIFMLRDPRGVVASYRDWKNQGGFDFEKDPDHRITLANEQARASRSYHPVIISLLWRAAYTAANEAIRNHGPQHIRVVSYEKLCSNPEQELSEIYKWLEVSTAPDVSAVPVRNSSYQAFESAGGFQKEPAKRWRDNISEEELIIIQALCRKQMIDSGYQLLRVRGGWMKSGCLLVSSLPALIRAARANASRSGRFMQYAWMRLQLLFR
jgi:hypothetical protein